MGMAMTPRKTFRNIVGHASGVGDMSSLSSWTAEQFDPSLSWADVEWIKKLWGGKLIIKGILDEEDARLAANTGADALIVSNHGGRQLDGAVSSIQALPGIVKNSPLRRPLPCFEWFLPSFLWVIPQRAIIGKSIQPKWRPLQFQPMLVFPDSFAKFQQQAQGQLPIHKWPNALPQFH